jgi:2-phosphosulfolactate phosphatase
MRWEVAFLPAELRPGTPLTIVVDALRASTSLVTLLANGARAARVLPSVEEVLRLARQRGWLAAGERGSLPPPGFDFGNSPAEFTPERVRGQTIVFSSTNGARALRIAARRSRQVLVGALANLTAVANAAASQGSDVVVVCAGQEGGQQVGLEDAYVAGRLAAIAARAGAELADSARVALACSERYDTPLAAFAASAHGQRLRALGLADDLAHCAATDWTSLVPRVARWARPLQVAAGPAG